MVSRRPAAHPTGGGPSKTGPFGPSRSGRKCESKLRPFAGRARDAQGAPHGAGALPHVPQSVAGRWSVSIKAGAVVFDGEDRVGAPARKPDQGPFGWRVAGDV